MNELFEKQGQSIHSFKSGDIIIRLKSIVKKKLVYNENLMVTIEVDDSKDSSFRESPVEFIGVKNNLIYVRSLKDSFLVGRYVSALKLEEFSEDWALFEIPEGLTLKDCI